MRIAVALPEFPLWSETFVLNHLTGLLDRGHEVDIYARLRGRETPVHEDVINYRLFDHAYYHHPHSKIGRLARIYAGCWAFMSNCVNAPRTVLFSLGSAKGLYRLLLFHAMTARQTKRRYEIVHCHFGPTAMNLLAYRELGMFQGKLITTFHGFDVSSYLIQAGNRAYDRLFRKGDLFLPVCNYFRQRLLQLGCPEDKALVHHMGVDCRKFSFASRCSEIERPLRVLTVARLVEKKGIAYGIRAVVKVAASGEKVRYDIIGDGPLKSDLQTLIRDLGAQKFVRLLDPVSQSEIVALLREADILLAPSVMAENGDCEGIPLVLMEAMASGLPVISTKHGGIPELIKDGASGLLVAEKAVEELADKLRCLMDNPGLRIEMGKIGRQCIVQNFNNDKLNDRLMEIYESALAPVPVL